MSKPLKHKRDVILEFNSSPDAILNALHQAGWQIIPKQSEPEPCLYCGEPENECPNCGRRLEDCNGNCIFDDLPNRGFELRDEGRSDGHGESYGERNA